MAVGFSPDGRFGYVVGRNSNNLIILDALTAADDPENSIVGFVKVGNKPVALAVGVGGALVYVANRNDDSVSVVDVSDPEAPVVLTEIPTGKKPQGAAILPDGSKLYVTNNKDNTVSVFEVQFAPTFLDLIGTIPVGKKPTGIAVTKEGSVPGGESVYVANHKDGTVSVIEAATDEVIATIPVGKGPKGVAAGLIPTAP